MLLHSICNKGKESGRRQQRTPLVVSNTPENYTGLHANGAHNQRQVATLFFEIVEWGHASAPTRRPAVLDCKIRV